MTDEILAYADADHYTAWRTSAPWCVVVHATGGRDSLAWLTRTSSPPVSCHVLITKLGNRLRLVRDEHTAWHAGLGVLHLGGKAQQNPNGCSLGLEIENMNDGADPYPDIQLAGACQQLASWRRKYRRLLVFRHSDLDSRKRDPLGLDVEALVWRSYRDYG